MAELIRLSDHANPITTPAPAMGLGSIDPENLLIPRPRPGLASISLCDLGKYGLRGAVTVLLEDYGDEYVASWPEVGAWA